MSTVVKYFDSAFAGAPVLNGQAGSLVALLDACLVNGYGLKSLDSLTVASEVATGVVSAGHGFHAEGVILVAGATPAGLNGEKRLTWVDSTTFKFAAPGIADGAASGSISAKIAPAGWEKVFSGTNKAVYRALSGNRHYLRVDNATNKAVVYGCENMTDADTFDVRFPTAAQVASPLWKASATTDSAARAWRLFADDRMFYLAARWTPSYMHDVYAFGEIADGFKPGDAYDTILAAIRIDDGYPQSAHTICASYMGSGLYLARGHTQLPGPVTARYVGHNPISGSSVRATGNPYPTGVLLPYPNMADNGFMISPAWLQEYPLGLRGKLPGLHCCWQYTPGSDGDIISSIQGFDDRRVLLQGWFGLFASDLGQSQASFDGRIAMDITGPWR